MYNSPLPLPAQEQALADAAELNKSAGHLMPSGDFTLLIRISQKINNTILITNSNRQIIWANRSFLEQSGYQLAEVQGKKPHEFLFDPITCVASENDNCVELCCKSKTGHCYWQRVEINPIYNHTNTITGYTAIGNDITLRKAQEEAISQQSREHEKISRILTRRELQVLEGVKEGLTYNEIGQKLFISPQTVNQHLKSIYRKMEVETRAKLVAKVVASKF